MIIKQCFTHPTSGEIETKDIEITLEEIRIDSNFAEPCLVARCDGSMASLSVRDHILVLLDSKRTFVPEGIYQTYLTKASKSNTITVNSYQDLRAVKGDPVRLEKSFAIIEEIMDNEIRLSHELPEYPAGTIVQNLAHRRENCLKEGISSKLKKPESIFFQAKKKGKSIEVIVPRLLNFNNIKLYDVYVRNHDFTEINSSWLAEARDINITNEYVIVDTYNGGEKLGDEPYFVTVIVKDGSGTFNVNESSCIFVERV